MDKSGGSRLLQMQARFQQKQMAEREMRIASLYEAQQARALGRVRQSPTAAPGLASAGSSPPPGAPAHVPVPPGKVRQMFEERRTKGIDKSYPLQPIHNTDRVAPRRKATNGYSRTTAAKHSVAERKTTTRTQVNGGIAKHERIDNISKGAGDLNHNHEPDMNRVRTLIRNGAGAGSDEVDNYRLEDETFPDALAPTPTPRTPDASATTATPTPAAPAASAAPHTMEPKRPPRRNSGAKMNPSNQKAPTKPTPAPVPPRRVSSENGVGTGSQGRGAMQRNTQPITNKTSLGPSSVKARSTTTAASPRASHAGAGGEGQPCSVCGRRFAEDRIKKHEEICRKANATKKRKPFDVLKHRLAGTEAEPFLNKVRRNVNSNSTQQASKPKSLNNNWRQKHEEFIQAIRAAKQVQAHLDAGGKLSDLPPPPPSENPDYVQCPHCSRRFNQGAAERHIPKCASYQFNKPKPQPQAGRRR